jgi:hypothetical protein
MLLKLPKASSKLPTMNEDEEEEEQERRRQKGDWDALLAASFGLVTTLHARVHGVHGMLGSENYRVLL